MLRFLLQQGRVGLLVLACACRSSPPKTPEPAPAPENAPEPAPVLSEAPTPPVLLREVGFLAPQAALHDPVQDVYLVSNRNGAAGEADGNGFISRISPDGSRITLKWIDGSTGVALDAPKGMALSGDKLYVADINVVRSFDRKSGQPLGKVAILTAHDLDAVAVAPDGTLYVSDTGLGKTEDEGGANPKGKAAKKPTAKGRAASKSAEAHRADGDAIYVVDARGVSRLLVKGAELGQPSGLLADSGGVWVTNLAGELYRVAADGTKAPGIALPGTGLHGVLATEGGHWIIASAQTSTIYIGKGRADPTGGSSPPESFEPLITELVTPGQAGYDRPRRQLIVPLVQDNALYIQQVPAAQAR